MNNIRKTFHLREVVIAAIVGLAMLITGAVLDFSITSKVYDINNTNMFGVVMSGFSQFPVIVSCYVAGLGFILARRKRPVWAQVLMIVGAVITFGVAAYLCFDTAKDWYSFRNTADHKTILLIAAILYTLVLPAITIVPAYFLMRKADKETILKVSILLLGTVLLAVIFSNILKYFVGRERPRSAFAKENPEQYFDAVWNIHPLRPLIGKIQDIWDKLFNGGEGGYKTNNFKSFPSGHTVYAAMGMMLYPLLTLFNDKTKNMRPLQISLFYVGLVWTVLTAISRVYAGAHYLSDTAFGLLTTVVCGVVAMVICSNTLKERKLLD